MRIISVCLLVIFAVLVLIVFPVFGQINYHFPEASEGQINEAVAKIVPIRWLPSHPLYFLIRAKETFSRSLQPSSVKRAEFDFVLSGKRLKEVYMLLDHGDSGGAKKSLLRYSTKLEDVGRQLEKARSQNQDVAALVAQMADGFKYQEVFLFAIVQKAQGSDLDTNINIAGASFVATIKIVNNISPGVEDRFKTIVEAKLRESSASALPSPSPEVGTYQASPSAKPRRIIY
ncbi:MAG: DUF5667 domain-containing protein [Candidatus Curtissbacteria bacterium]|nr:DUF5667 domain-containing protein [Candidatus Curtissbacteria bacterium]